MLLVALLVTCLATDAPASLDSAAPSLPAVPPTVLASIARDAGDSASPYTDHVSELTIGLEITRPRFRIEDVVGVYSTRVHFFTGRPSYYQGWHFQGSFALGRAGAHSGYGFDVGSGMWQTDYWLNYEVPWQALDPVQASLKGFYVDAGPMVYVRGRLVTLRMSATVPFSATKLFAELPGAGKAKWIPCFGIGASVQGDLVLLPPLCLTVGYKLSRVLPSEPQYTLGDEVIIRGRFGTLDEAYAGLSVRLRK